MLIIEHRINTSELLKKVPPHHGVEIDLRSNEDGLYLAHDAFCSGENFEDWLVAWRGQFIVLNVKEEGIEDRTLGLLSKFRVAEYFFLDQSFPFLQKLVRSGNGNTAARISDIESISTAVNAGAKWVWLDCFSGNWSYLKQISKELKEMQVKSCLVSPELQRPYDVHPEIEKLKIILKDIELLPDAVCTKNAEVWQNFQF